MFCTTLRPGTSENQVVVSLHGELDLVEVARVAAALRALVARGLWIIVDLSGLDFIDAAGVAALSRGRRRACDAGGGLVLAAPQPRVQRVLSLLWEADGSGVQASMAAATASCAVRSGGSLVRSAGRASP